MKSTELTHISDHWKPGDTVWACAFAYNKAGTAFSAHQRPVRGKLAATPHELIGTAPWQHPVRYFVPFGRDGETLTWSKSVNVFSRDIADTEQEAVELYNARVQAYIDQCQARIETCRSYLIRTVSDA